ncbi:DEAD/DEAH box helicase [Nostoc sp. WHI]|uniref:DEAD/DEAH box helicase n=1 Tax=Nostoc sp. WHI TaxID=2650611 RepID=UPI001E445BD6|nr:DEAD/DEAH box helicase [Nostoc sp. WHI]
MINEYFQTLTTFAPRNFQRETIAKLLQRQDILLRAPTGSGKTETAIAPSNSHFENKRR